MKEIDKLLSSILRICFLPEDKAVDPQDLDIINSFNKDSLIWDKLYEALWLTKIESIVYYMLHNKKVLSSLPEDVAKRFFHAYAGSCVKNRRFYNKTIEIILNLNQKNVNPALLKGILIAFDLYPDFGSRSMTDVDYYIPANRKQEAMTVFTQLGFKNAPHLDSDENVFNGIDSDANLIDIHFKCPFFQKYSESEIYQECSNAELFKGKFYVMEPNAFLAFLIDHQLKHITYDGLSFNFFFDLMFLYRKYGDKLELEKFSKYFKTQDHWTVFHRANLFLKEFGAEINLPFTKNDNNKLLPFSVRQVYQRKAYNYLGLARRYKAWFRLILSWFGVIDKKLLNTPNIIEVTECIFNDLRKLKYQAE